MIYFQLKNDLMGHVFSYVEAPTLAAANAVSRQWKKQSDQPRLWNALFEKIVGEHIQRETPSLPRNLTSRQFLTKHAVHSIEGIVAAARTFFSQAPADKLSTFSCDFSPIPYDIMARMEPGFYNYDTLSFTHKCYCFLPPLEKGRYFAHEVTFDSGLAGWWDIRGSIPPSIKEKLIASFAEIIGERFKELIAEEFKEASSSSCRIL